MWGRENLLKNTNNSRSRAFGGANENVNQIGVGVEFARVNHPVVDFVATLNLLQYAEEYFYRQYFCDFVGNVEGGVEN